MAPDPRSSKLALEGGTPVRSEPYPPWPDYGEEEVAAAVAVLRSGHLARQSGSEVRAFEQAFAERYGVKHAIAVSSGTAALHVALAALGVGPGDDVINTAHCFIGTATPVLHAGAVPIFADIDPRTFNIDPASVETKITPHTKAIVPVHLNGCPADMAAFLDIAQRHDLFVVEDAAQAHGALYDGQLVGTIGDVGCFSFWEDKILTTGGEGGMVITDDDDLAHRARKIHHHGEERSDGDYYAAERLYFHDMLGYNFRMTEVQGALGRVQLTRLDDYVAARRQHAHHLSRLLADVPGIIPPYEPPEAQHAFYKYIIRLDCDVITAPALQFMTALQAEGIACSRRYPTPLHQQPLFTEHKGYGNTQAPFSWYEGTLPQYGSGLPAAEQLPDALIMIRMQPTFSEQDVEQIAQAVAKVAAAYSV